jgi:hypothetical protein
VKISISIDAAKNVIAAAKIKANLQDALDQGAANAEALLARPTTSWKHKAPMHTERGPWWRASGTDDDIYGYVSKGTKAHVIRARKGGRLAFGPSTPKTRPGSLTGSAGSRGPVDTFRRQVHHPGTKARRFDKLAAEELRATWPKIVQRNIDEASR